MALVAAAPSPMPAPRRQSLAAQFLRSWGVLWLLAGGLGTLASVLIVSGGILRHLGALAEAALAVGVGWMTMLAFAPWRPTVRWLTGSSEMRRISASLRRLESFGGRPPLADLATDRDDEIGELSRAIHEALSRAVADRVEARHLRRTLDESIRRETERATDRLQREASTDPLTGLGNRRALRASLRDFAADETLSSCLVLDIDRFKNLNDALGHRAGDECLAFLGRLLRSTLRGGDIAFRIGGDEFLVLLPQQRADAARAVAERLTSLFGQMPWPHPDLVSPTLSVGLATGSRADLADPEELVWRADEAMLGAKRAGGACVRDWAELQEAA